MLLTSACSDPKNESYDVDEKRLITLIYNGVEAGPDPKMFEYPVDGTWASTVKNHPYYAYNQPHLCWKTAWVLDGFYYAYASTRDPIFRDKFIELVNELLKRRDSSQNMVSWNGKIYPVWGGTSRYHAAKFDLVDITGKNKGILFFHTVHNDQTEVSIKNVRGPNFDIEISHKEKTYTINDVTLEKLDSRLKAEIEWTIYQSPLPGNRVVEFLRFSGHSEPEEPLIERSRSLVTNITVPELVINGIVLRPMMLMYRLLKHNGEETLALTLKQPIQEAINAFLPITWHDLGTLGGYFKKPDNSPTVYGGGCIDPWNQQADFVATIAILAEDSEDAYLSSIVQKWATYFISKIEKTERGYLWRYWDDPLGNITWYDSTNYAGIVVNAVIEIYNTGIAFTNHDILELATMLNKRILSPDNSEKISNRIDGSGAGHTSALYRYLGLIRFTPKIRNVLISSDKLDPDGIRWDQAARLLYFIRNPN